jgi:hypothetical protein
MTGWSAASPGALLGGRDQDYHRAATLLGDNDVALKRSSRTEQGRSSMWDTAVKGSPDRPEPRLQVTSVVFCNRWLPVNFRYAPLTTDGPGLIQRKKLSCFHASLVWSMLHWRLR